MVMVSRLDSLKNMVASSPLFELQQEGGNERECEPRVRRENDGEVECWWK